MCRLDCACRPWPRSPQFTSGPSPSRPAFPGPALAPLSPNALALVELLIRERRALSRFIARYLDPASTEDTLQNLYLKASSVPGDPPILEPRRCPRTARDGRVRRRHGRGRPRWRGAGAGPGTAA
ncbi:hypothetical protein G6F32_015507 [Rhizopus arrhizus]|nr:hypothetical protein G6F32_015507 [Rhizopus arrhizus]